MNNKAEKLFNTYLSSFLENFSKDIIDLSSIIYEICEKSRKVNFTEKLTASFIDDWVSFYDTPDIFMSNIYEFLNPETSQEDLAFIPKIYNPESFQNYLQENLTGLLLSHENELEDIVRKEIPEESTEGRVVIYRLYNDTNKKFRILQNQFGILLPELGITAEEILALYNEHTKKTIGTEVDLDIESISAFKAGITRYKKFWDNSFN